MVDVGIAAAHVGGVLHVGHFAGGVVVELDGAAVAAGDGAVGVVCGGGHGGANGEVVAQGAVVYACYAAVVIAVVGVGGGEGGGAGTLLDGAAVVAHDAAVAVGTGLHGADGYVVGHVAAGDGAVVGAHDAAGGFVTGDAGVGEGEVVDIGTGVCLAEDALVVVGGVVAALVDADAADGIVIAVEVAAEGAVVASVVASDGLEVALVAIEVVPIVAGGVLDVVVELEVRVVVVVGGLAVCAVDAVGQEVELAGVFDDVGTALAAVAAPGEDGEDFGVDADGHVGGGHGEGRAFEGACVSGVAVLVAVGNVAGCGVREREADYFVAAGIEHIHYIIII